jgi:DNA-directed RNA polymerase sigma subunit (sigma70/sigma32)
MEPVDNAGRIYEQLRRGEEPPGWETLTGRQAYVLTQRVVAGRTMADIGEEMGVSRERVRQHEAQALLKLAAWQS